MTCLFGHNKEPLLIVRTVSFTFSFSFVLQQDRPHRLY